MKHQSNRMVFQKLYNLSSRRQSCFQHVKRRLWERYNIHISKLEYEDLVRKINDNPNRYYFTKHEGKTKRIYKYPFKGKTVFFLYDDYIQGIRTVFPPDYKPDEYRHLSLQEDNLN